MKELFAGTLFTEAVFADGQEYERAFRESHKKEDAQNALRCYTAAANVTHPSEEAVKAKQNMESILERFRKVEAARNAYESGQKLTAEEMYTLGRNDYDGFLSRKNIKQGMLWIGDAADHGHVRAQFEFGEYCLSLYHASEKKVSTGLHYLELAARSGCADAQKKLGDVYSRGRHVPADLEKAKMWYSLAAENGCSLAQISMRHLERRRPVSF